MAHRLPASSALNLGSVLAAEGWAGWAVDERRRQPQRMNRVGFTLFISVFFLIGFGLLGWGLTSLYRGRQALAWPTAEAGLSECRLQEHSDSDGTTWEVIVRYRYGVDGREYEGNRLAFGYAASSAGAEHRAIHEKLQRATRVQVRYDPGNPARSVLAAGFNRSTFTVLVFAVTWLLFTTGFTMLWTSSNGKDSRVLEQIRVLE